MIVFRVQDESENERKGSSPVNIPVETVLINNEYGFYGHCESLDSPKSSFDAELFDSMAASKFLKEYINFNDEPQHTGILILKLSSTFFYWFFYLSNIALIEHINTG